MDSFTGIPQWCLRSIGIKLESLEDIDCTSQKIKSLLPILYMSCTFVGTANSCFLNRHDMVVFLETLGFAFTNLQTISKAILIFMKRKELFLLKEKMIKLFSQENGECQVQLVRLNKKVHFLLKMFYILIAACTFVFGIIPPVRFFYLVYIKQVNETVSRVFPYSNVPLFDTKLDIVYFLYYLFLVGHGFIYVQVITATDGFFFMFAMNVKEHFKILQDQFRSNQFYGSLKLRKIIQHHVELIRTTEMLNDTFQLIMFTQALLKALTMCILTFKIAFARDLRTILGYVLFLIALLIELFAFCYGGEAISYESFSVQTAIKESSWYNLPANEMKTLQLILLRAQKPLKLEAKFFELNFKLFLVILRTSVSYITIVKTFHK